MLSIGPSKINNYNTEASSDSGYMSDISECSFYNYKNIDLFNTKTFNYHVKQILEIYFVFNRLCFFPNLFDNNCSNITFFGEYSEQDFKEYFNTPL
jgi:hypothetical protein